MKEQRRTHYLKHKAYYQEKNRRWVQENPLANRKRVRSYKLRRFIAGTYTADQWEKLLEAAGRRCLRCGRTDRIEPDHVIPLSKGGPNTIANLQPLCRSCNSSKKVKTIDYRDAALREFAASLVNPDLCPTCHGCGRVAKVPASVDIVK